MFTDIALSEVRSDGKRYLALLVTLRSSRRMATACEASGTRAAATAAILNIRAYHSDHC